MQTEWPGLVPLLTPLFIYIFIGLIVSYASKFTKIEVDNKLFVGVVGSYTGGMLSYLTHNPSFKLTAPIIGSMAFLYFARRKQNK